MDPDSRRGTRTRAGPRGPAAHPRPPQRRRGVRELLAEEVPRPEALQPRGGRVADPDARRAPLLRGRRRSERRRPRNRAPRPPQRARQHRRQELQPDLPRVRGGARPVVGAGIRRRQVPRRRDRDPRRTVGRDRRRDTCVQPEPPRGRRPGRGRDGTRHGGPDRRHRTLARAPGSRARRRGVRRAGCGRGDAQPVRSPRLRGRRDRPHRGEQPARVHDRAGARALGRLCDRRRQDGPGSDLPCER